MFWLILASNSLFASNRDTTASLILDNVVLLKADQLEFDLRLLRHSENWSAFANGTFQIGFVEETFELTNQKLQLEFTGETDLNLFPLTGEQMPVDGYIINPLIIDNKRISIMVAGPELYEWSKFVPINDNGILLGKFRITAKDGDMLPGHLKWLEPFDYFQACAHKLEYDSLLAPGVVWQTKDNNVELYDTLTSAINYIYRAAPMPDFILNYFRVSYAGAKRVLVEWGTSNEPFNDGFILKRTQRAFGRALPCDLEYNDVIAHYSTDYELRSKGNSIKGGNYSYEDMVEFRGPEYCYELSYHKRNINIDTIIVLDCGCTPIPNAVISYGQANPNPFSYSTSVNYTLDDDVYLTVTVHDVNGREIAQLINNERKNKGNHVLEFLAPQLASNGMYDIIFIAVPIDDESIEKSTAVVKTQLLR